MIGYHPLGGVQTIGWVAVDAMTVDVSVNAAGSVDVNGNVFVGKIHCKVGEAGMTAVI